MRLDVKVRPHHTLEDGKQALGRDLSWRIYEGAGQMLPEDARGLTAGGHNAGR